jgi:hypothetical protein
MRATVSSLALSSIHLPSLAANNPCHYGSHGFHCCQFPYKIQNAGGANLKASSGVYFS